MTRPELTSDTRLQVALAQQAATDEILRVMAASPTDVQPVLDAVTQRAAQLCHAPFALLNLVDGEYLLSRAYYPEDPVLASRFDAVHLVRSSITGRAILDRATVHVADIVPLLDTEFPEARGNAVRAGARAVLGIPLIREGQALGALFLWRTEPGLFTPDQVALVETFARQAAIAIGNVRQFHATQEALEQQTATAEILRAISRSQHDLQPVFDTIAENALRLCGGVFSGVFRFDGELIHIGALRQLDLERVAAFRTAYPSPPSRSGTTQRAILTRSIVHMPDVGMDPEYEHRDVARLVGFRSVVSVPMLREGEAIGAITVFRDIAGPFPAAQIELLKTFADQAVIAIRNVQLFTELERRNRDLTEALEQQTATSEILRVISQSQTDVQPVFDAIAGAALQLCNANHAVVTRYDGTLIHVAAMANVNPRQAEAVCRAYPRPPGNDSATARAVHTRQLAVVPDVLEDREYTVTQASLDAGFRSVVAVPLIRDAASIGTITVGRPEPGPFPDAQIELLKIFADQAVIAIQNVRLFTELERRNHDLTEALEQQTATSEILRVISRSQTNVQPVFDTIAAAVVQLCRAQFANVFTYDGELIHLVAYVNVHADYIQFLRQLYPMPPGRRTAVARAIGTCEVCMIEDVLADPDYGIAGASATGGFRSILAVPLLRGGSAIGGIAVGRPEPGPFPQSQVALLQTFADQAVIAIENVRLFKEVQERTAQLVRSVDELRALGDVGQAVSSTLDLGTVLSTIVSRAVQLTGMDGGSIYEYDEAREEFHLHTTDRLPPELVEAMRAEPVGKDEGVLGKIAVAGAPVEIVDLLDKSSYQSRVRDELARTGYRSLLGVPLHRDNQLLGGLVVNRKTAGAFDPQVIELLKTFATQSAIAIQNARLFREIETKSRQLETASRHKSEFLANMSHELRTPLNAIIGFSDVLSERLFGEMNDKQAEYVGDIADSGRHLLALINDILDLSKIEAGRIELEPSDFDLGTAIGQALSLVRERAQRRGIALDSAVGARVGAVRADERKVKQVLLNLLSNALKFTPEGGSIDVRASGFDDRVEVAVRDTGVGIAPQDQEAVFEEFKQVGANAAKVEGTGLGLAISRKFIELHGGRLWLQSEVGKGSTFTFSLPRS